MEANQENISANTQKARANKTSLLTPDPPRDQAVVTVTTSTRSRSIAPSQTYASKTQTLENYYLNPAFKWPADLGVFNRDWIAYTISPGFFRVVAFPSDGRNEVLFLEFDT